MNRTIEEEYSYVCVEQPPLSHPPKVVRHCQDEMHFQLYNKDDEDDEEEDDHGGHCLTTKHSLNLKSRQLL